MARKIQFKRGLKKNLPTLSPGEMALTTDTKETFIGNEDNKNIKIINENDTKDFASKLSVEALSTQLVDNVSMSSSDENYILHNTIYVGANDVSTEIELDVTSFSTAIFVVRGNGASDCQGLVYLKNGVDKGSLFTSTVTGREVSKTFNISSLTSILVQVKNVDTVKANTITSEFYLTY